MLLLINDFEKINILEYAFGEGGGGQQKAYAVYAFINVDNCERPLTLRTMLSMVMHHSCQLTKLGSPAANIIVHALLCKILCTIM